MPTIYLRPPRRSFPHFYRVAERMAMRKMSSFLMMFGMLEFFQRTTRNDGRTRRLPSGHVIIPIMATLAAAMLHEEIWLCRTTFYAPPMAKPMLRFKSTFWNGPTVFC